MATYNNIKKIKIGDNVFNLYDSGNTTYSAGTGLSLSNTTFNHSNSVTAGTVGTSSATSGSTLAVPYVIYDAQGHITATGTHTHTISGFLTSSSTLDATKLSGTIPSSCYTNTTYGIATNTTNGLVKPWYTHTAASTGPTTGNNATAVAVNAITTTAGKYYAVEADSNGRLFVNVPWTDHTYTVPTITLNGSTTTSPSFYAPTSAGTSDYVLKSNGSGAPTWYLLSGADIPYNEGSITVDDAIQNLENSLSSYLPLSGGTLTGTLTITNGHIKIPNLGSNNDTGSIKIADSNGDYYRALYCTDANNLVLGYDWYNSSIGATYVGGAPLYLRSTGAPIYSSADLIVGGHSSQIGTVLTSHLTAAKSVDASTAVSLCSISLPKGTWVIIGQVRFPANNTGARRANITTGNGNNDIHIQSYNAQGALTQCQVSCIAEVTANSTTYYLNVYHTATTALTMPAGTSEGYINGLRAVRIA